VISSVRIAVFGGTDLRASVVALGLEPVTDDPDIALIDARDRDAVGSAAAVPAHVPRVVVVFDTDRLLIAALGIDPSRVVTSVEPAALGPILMRARPQRPRAATRVVVATGVRGGVGRSLLAANLALRIATRVRVCVVDGTGQGAASWWLRCSPRPWTEFEGLVDELTADHLAVMAEETSSGMRVIGGTSVVPTPALLSATIRAAMGLADLVVVDAPLRNDPLARAAAALADRVFVLAYDDPWSKLMLDADPPSDDEWLIASQMKTAAVHERRAFRALPRDESAVASAVASRGAAKGALGKAYDELADLLVIDAT
jgi:hypothetical protein